MHAAKKKPTKPPPRRTSSGEQPRVKPAPPSYVSKRIAELSAEHGWDAEAVEKIVKDEPEE